MPKKRAPLPPSSNDTPPDSPPPPPPGKLHPKHSSSSSSLRSITSTGSGSGFEMGVNRQNPRHLPFFYSNFTSQEEVLRILKCLYNASRSYMMLRSPWKVYEFNECFFSPNLKILVGFGFHCISEKIANYYFHFVPFKILLIYLELFIDISVC